MEPQKLVAMSPQHSLWNARRLEQARAMGIPLELMYYGQATILPDDSKGSFPAHADGLEVCGL